MVNAHHREEALKQLRPTIDVTAAVSPVEQFQNVSLRPILKFQNDLLVTLFKSHLGQRKVTLNGLQVGERNVAIRKMYKQDSVFKSIAIHTVVGLLLLEELDFYFKHRSELNRRICEMCAQRIISQWGIESTV